MSIVSAHFPSGSGEERQQASSVPAEFPSAANPKAQREFICAATNIAHQNID